MITINFYINFQNYSLSTSKKPLVFCLPTLTLFPFMWQKVSSGVQAGFSLVPIYQRLQLRWVGTTLDASSPNTPKQYVHTDTDGYHHGDGLRPWRRCWRWLWKEALSAWQEEKLYHISPHGDLWIEQQLYECAKWSGSKDSTWRVLLNGALTDVCTDTWM